MNEVTLDFMYTHWGNRLGWMSKLSEMFSLSLEDVQWLEWRDCNEEGVRQRIKDWEEEIEREGRIDIYNEDDLGRKLLLLNNRIDAIEKQAETFTLPENRMFFLGISSLDKLSGLRYKVRNQLLTKEMPDRDVIITDQEIDSARLVPLSRVIQNIPKSKKILCPFHKEKTPSFHVDKWGFCFGCGKSIDALGWVMGQLGKSFIDAVRWLNRIGI